MKTASALAIPISVDRAQTMRAVVQDVYGSPDVLSLREVARPVAGAKRVLVRVRAAGVNPADCALLRGEPYVMRLGMGLRGPSARIRGMDLSGTVESVGEDVTRFRPGDEVFGVGTGTFAELAVAEEKQLVLKPANLGFEEAASVPLAGLAALQALRDQGEVRAGHRVLINGAAGGIGTFAVQIAKVLGAEVTAVCSGGKAELVRSLGADHVLDYAQADFTATGERYDFILDNVGNHSLSRLRATLARRGTLVPNNGGFDNRWFACIGRVIVARLTSMFVTQRLRPFLSLSRTDDLTALEELLESGRIRPVIDRVYPLERAAEALAYVAQGHAQGKVVVTPG